MVKGFSSKIDQIKATIQGIALKTNQKIEDTERVVFGKIEELKLQIADTLKSISTQETRLVNMADYLKDYDVMGANLRTSIEEMQKMVEHFGETKADAHAFEKEVEQKTTQISVLQGRTMDLANNLMGVEGYVERYLPLKTQTMITEACGSFLSKKDKKKLDDYTRAKLGEMREEMLVDSPATLE